MFSEDEVHKIAILDLRIFNLDRNECNILVQEFETNSIYAENESNFNTSIGTEYLISNNNTFLKKNIERKLIPIDHGLSIPDTLAVFSYDLIWTSW